MCSSDLFDEAGGFDAARSRVLSAEAGCLGMDLPPGVWHSLVALEETVIYEVKGHPAGGYVEARDKDFAAWSPAEGSPEAEACERELALLAASLLT